MKNITFDSTGGTISYTYSFRGPEGDKALSFSTESTWLTISSSSTEVTISASDLGTSTSSRSGIVSVFVNGDLCEKKQFNVIQNGYACNCDDLTLNTTSLSEWDYNNTDVKTVSYTTSASCISSVTANNTSHFNVRVSNGTITVQPKGENTSISPYNDTITVSYMASGKNCSKTFIATQNAKTCVEASCKCYKVSNATASTVPSTATSATVSWSYTEITWTTASTCAVTSAKTSSGTASTIVKFDAATCDNTTKSGYFKWDGHKACGDNGCSSNDVEVNWSITQQKPSGCSCTCDDLEVEKNSKGWAADDTSQSDIHIYSSSCITNITLSSLNHFSATLRNDKVTIKPNSENATADDINETLTISYESNGTSCTKSISLKHRGIPCNCDDFDVSGTSIQFDSEAQSDVILGSITESGVCITDVAVSSSESWVKNLNINENYIIGDIEANSSNARTATITVSYKAKTEICDGKTFTITQKSSGTCDCGNLTISSNNEVWNANDTTPRDITITSSSCISNIDIGTSSMSHFKAVLGNNKITVCPNSGNTTEYDIKELLQIIYTATTEPCLQTVNLTHKGVTCECLEISDAPITLMVDSSTTIPYTVHDCVSDISVSTSDSSIATVNNNTNNTLTINGVGIGNATITISFKSNGSNCHKDIEVSVNCSNVKITPNPSTLTCSGGTVTFTAS